MIHGALLPELQEPGIEWRTLAWPETVSGRPVTKRGVHLLPFAFHGDWLKGAYGVQYWLDLLVSMGMSWVVIINDGDSVRQTYGTAKSPLEWLLDAGIIALIREGGQSFPHDFVDHETFLWTVDLYAKYGLKPPWIIRNEPFDDREWDGKWLKRNKRSKAEKWDIILDVWCKAAQFIASNGGYVGFPDGPSYSDRFDPFLAIQAHDCQWIFDEGLGFYAGHHYCKGRPRDYPYSLYVQTGHEEIVNGIGRLLTEADITAYLDDFAEDPKWREETAETINQQRFDKDWLRPGATALNDDTCWRGWEKVAYRSLKTFGYVVPLAMTEGGCCPRDRAGTGSDIDYRMPHTTLKMVGKRTLEMFQMPSPFFALCPWLLADEDMGGSGWPNDAWHGGAFPEYGRPKPVVQMLIDNPPTTTTVTPSIRPAWAVEVEQYLQASREGVATAREWLRGE